MASAGVAGGQTEQVRLPLSRARERGMQGIRRCRGAPHWWPGGEGRSEWRWPLAVVLVVALTVEVAAQVAASQRAIGWHFVGMFWGLNDPAQYFSAMRQGAASPGWLIYDRFTAEPHSPALLYVVYVALGKLARLAGLGIEETFRAASLAGRIALPLAAYFATGLVSRDRTTRRLGLVLVVFSSGVGGLLALLHLFTGLDLPLAARERNDPELSTFLVLFTAPHLMFGLSLLLVAVRLYSACWEGGRPRRHLALAVVVTLLGLTNPFTLVPFCAVVAVHGTVMTVRARRTDPAGLGGVAVALLAAAPLVLGNAVTFTFDPFWSLTYGRQNQTPTPPLDETLLALGLLVPLALLGLPGLLRGATPGRLLILVWVVLAFVLMQAPTGVQRRFGIGLHPMLALAASLGAVLVWRTLRTARGLGAKAGRLVVLAGLGQALFGTSAYMLVFTLVLALAPSQGWLATPAPGSGQALYQPAELRTAADWLAEQSAPDDLVLASVLTGNYLAGIAPGRVYVGHWVATLDYQAKAGQVSWFFAAPLDEERRAFLRANGARYVVYGPHERALGAEPPSSAGTPPVYSGSGVEIFLASDLTGAAGVGTPGAYPERGAPSGWEAPESRDGPAGS